MQQILSVAVRQPRKQALRYSNTRWESRI